MTILIIGMHRSGTSAVTALIQSMGAYVGAPGELLPPSPDNPEGFFERNDVLAINRAIMKHHGCNWHQVEAFDKAATPLPSAIHNEMARTVKYLDAHAPFAMKDPRFCFTLPYWLPYLKKLQIVLVVRHPAAIANSLELRNQMPSLQGLALWQNYMEHALKNLRGLSVTRCHYEQLLATPEAETKRMHAALNKDHPTLTAPDISLLEPKLVRASAANISLHPTHQALYNQLA
jgi:hypothetical protein